MIIALEGCGHQAVEGIQSAYVPEEYLVVTCVSCYYRWSVPLHGNFTDRRTWTRAIAPPPCPHVVKKPVQKTLTRYREYHDAICMDCGRVLRHPDGPGSWEDVLFYGFVITERPF